MTARSLKPAELPLLERPGLKRAVLRARPISECPSLHVPGRDGFELTTERTRITPATVSDAGEFFMAVDASRATLRPFLPWVTFVNEPSGAFRYLDASERDWDDARACRFAIRDKETHRFLGIVSFEHLAHAHLSGDFGYWLRDDAAGSGLLAESGKCLLAWAFHSLGAERIRVAASTMNSRSLKTIQRLGFRYEGTARRAERCNGEWLDHSVFSLLRDEGPTEPLTSRGRA